MKNGHVLQDGSTIVGNDDFSVAGLDLEVEGSRAEQWVRTGTMC